MIPRSTENIREVLQAARQVIFWTRIVAVVVTIVLIINILRILGVVT